MHDMPRRSSREENLVPVSTRPLLPINSTSNSTPSRTPVSCYSPDELQRENSEATDLAHESQTLHLDRKGQPLQEILPLTHRWKHTHSILSVVAAPSKGLILCGTQDSKILVFEISTYSLKHVIDCGQKGLATSILCMITDENENYLFAAGSDSLVKIWDLRPFDNKAAATYDIRCTHLVYSTFDIGDIFSISWSPSLSTLMIGAQNASISWCTLDLRVVEGSQPSLKISRLKSSFEKLPHLRFDRFFDSKGPGGAMNRAQSEHQLLRSTSSIVEGPELIEISHENVLNFAHNGYVYCMVFLDYKNASAFCDLQSDRNSKFLLSCGGDGVIKIWAVTEKDKRIHMKPIRSLENDESVISMHVMDSSVYVGLGDSTINVWDLTTYQLTRSFHFTARDEQASHEILSLCIYNGHIYKATNAGNLCKFPLKQDPLVESSAESSTASAIDFSQQLEQWSIEIGNDSVFSVSIFEHQGSNYLVSGGTGSLCLWNITKVDEVGATSAEVVNNPSTSKKSDVIECSNGDLLQSLRRSVTYRTISKYPNLYLEESRRCARFFGRLFIDLGATESKLLPVPNCNPIVYAKFERNSTEIQNERPIRILWYGHYDVVDAIQGKDRWESNPFKLDAKDGNLYARGVTDNKGPVLAAMYAVAELKKQKKLTTDIVFLIEGEEECGSIGFQDAVQTHKNMIGQIDWIMFSNSYWLGDETPCLNYGLRGVVNASISVESKKPDRHSGVDGGVSREPTMDLIQLLGQLVCPETNKIQIPGFYDDALPIDEAELLRFEKIKDCVKEGEIVDTNLDSLVARWRNPSLTVHRIDVSGPKNNTVIPQRAKASISIRVVPVQDLSKIKSSLISFLKKNFELLKTDNKLDIEFFHEAEPWLGDPNNLVYQILYEKLKINWGPSVQEPLFIREGGSIPSIRFLEKTFNAQAAQIPCGQASDNAHLKNEKLRILNLFKLRDILEDTFQELGLHLQ